jgi:hypothetical protein
MRTRVFENTRAQRALDEELFSALDPSKKGEAWLLVESILARGANPNARRALARPVHEPVLVYSKNDPWAPMILPKRPQAGQWGWATPLGALCSSESCDASVDVVGDDEDPFAPLAFARDERLAGPLEALLRFGADPNAVFDCHVATQSVPNAEGPATYKMTWRPLHFATSRLWVRCVELLADHGADPGLRLDDDTRAVDQLFGEHRNAELTRRSLAALSILMRAGSAADAQSPGGDPLLHQAARILNPALLAGLLARGGDPNARGRGSPNTPLHCLARRPARDADTFADELGVERERELARQMAKILLDAGADLGARDENGKTARELGGALAWALEALEADREREELEGFLGRFGERVDVPSRL